MAKIIGGAVTVLFFGSWLVIAAYIFRNIFIGLMVNNFQAATKTEEKRQATIGTQPTAASAVVSPPTVGGGPAPLRKVIKKRHLFSNLQQISMLSEGTVDEPWRWTEAATRTTKRIASLKAETKWPRDTLFEYLQIITVLQENFLEYQQMHHLAAVVLHVFHF